MKAWTVLVDDPTTDATVLECAVAAPNRRRARASFVAAGLTSKRGAPVARADVLLPEAAVGVVFVRDIADSAWRSHR